MQRYNHVPLQCQERGRCWIILKLFHLTSDPTQGICGITGLSRAKASNWMGNEFAMSASNPYLIWSV